MHLPLYSNKCACHLNLPQAVKAPVRGDSGASNMPILLWCIRCTGSTCSLARAMFMPQFQRVQRLRRGSATRQDAHRAPACMNSTRQLPETYRVFPFATPIPTICTVELWCVRIIRRHAGARRLVGPLIRTLRLERQHVDIAILVQSGRRLRIANASTPDA